MTLHVCVLGVDGCGKSTVTNALPQVLTAELNLRAGSAGAVFRIVDPDQDHLAPGFHPQEFPATGHLAKRIKQIAKYVVDNRRLYPVFKLAHLALQDATTHKLSRRYAPDIIVSDGNLLLSAMGRASNYLCPASDGAPANVRAPNAADLKAVLDYLIDGRPLPAPSQARLPNLTWVARIRRLIRRLRLPAGWLPDVVILLDISPECALARITSRGFRVDRHENRADLDQARQMYLKTLDAFRLYRSTAAGHCIQVDHLSPGEVIQATVAAIRSHLVARQWDHVTARREPLGTTTEDLAGQAIWGKLFNRCYMIDYLPRKWFRGAWRELTFAFSRPGQLLLKEGYSAGMMRTIYDQDDHDYSPLDRICLDYPLHRAVYDRLHILTRHIETELAVRLQAGQDIHIFTAPSGFAYDLFRPLETIASRTPGAMQYIHVVAADLDPHSYVAEELATRARQLGIHLTFLRGDITDETMRARSGQGAPYDMALFVGLSSWLPKPQIVAHLKWLCAHMQPDGILVTDRFTPAAYALSGRCVGYKASYYPPAVYCSLLDYCGFDGLNALVESGRDQINYVLLAKSGSVGTGEQGKQGNFTLASSSLTPQLDQ